MDAITVYAVVQKLIGPVYPVGETNEDNKRFENLKNLCELLDKIHEDVDRIAWDYKDMSEFSIKRACDFANRQLDNMGISK